MLTNVWHYDRNAFNSRFSNTYSFQKPIVLPFWRLAFPITLGELRSQAVQWRLIQAIQIHLPARLLPANPHLLYVASFSSVALQLTEPREALRFQYYVLLPGLLERNQVQIQSGKWPEAGVIVGFCPPLILVLE